MQGFSLAAGDLPPHSKSKTQIMPLAEQDWQPPGLFSSRINRETRRAVLDRISERAKRSDRGK